MKGMSMRHAVIGAALLLLAMAPLAKGDRHLPKLTLEAYLKLDRSAVHKCKPDKDQRAVEAREAAPVHLTSYFQPLWPMAAGQTIPESGYLVYEVLINPNGVPACFELLETNFRHWEFQDATEKAIRKWRYEAPKDSAGQNVWCYTYVLVKY